MMSQRKDVVTIVDVNKYSIFRAHRFLVIKNEDDGNKELLGMGYCYNCVPFPCLCSHDENETNELALMGKSESKHSKEKLDS